MSDSESVRSATARTTAEPLPPANAPGSPPRAPGSAPALPQQALEIASGYAFTGPALDPGALHRHGPVAGATGTGRTRTLQPIAEQLGAQGVPVFLAEVRRRR